MNGGRVRALRWRHGSIAALLLIALGVVYWYWCLCWGPATTVVLVRHADRQAGADALTARGVARAEELAHALEKAGISAIYTSEAARTQETAAPTARSLGITPVVMAGADVAGLVHDIFSRHRGENVLVVGHGDSVPLIIAELGGPTLTIAGDEYDNLYVSKPCRCRWGSFGLTQLQYGAASP